MKFENIVQGEDVSEDEEKEDDSTCSDSELGNATKEGDDDSQSNEHDYENDTSTLDDNNVDRTGTRHLFFDIMCRMMINLIHLMYCLVWKQDLMHII